jgi:uncharacterized protein YbjQ (UPF0145 family)
VKKIVSGIIVLAAFMAVGNVSAKDERWTYSLDEALKSRAAKLKLDPNIKLYFGNQAQPTILQSIAEWNVRRTTNGFARTDKKACQRAFVSALIELQEKAKQQGANAIVNIKSNYMNVERSSETDFECVSGHLVSVIEMKGRLVKLAPN